MKNFKLTKKKIFLFIVILILLGIVTYRIAGAIKPPAATDKIPVNVITSVVEKGNIYATSPLTGRIDPNESAAVLPLAPGEVSKVYVSLGDRVEKGDILFTLDKTQAQVSYNAAKLSHDSAKAELGRMETLYKEGAISQQQYQGVKTQYDLAKQNLSAAADALSYSTVTSPISGYVTSVNISEGSLASQASPAVTVADVSSLKINTNVSEYLIGKIATGDRVDILIKSLSDNAFKGTITAISPAPALGTLTYPVTISIDDDSDQIKAGMFAEIQVVSQMKENVLCIPSDAVFIKSGETKVVTLQGNIPSLVTVVTGLDNGKQVEVVEGLKEGELIVISGQHYVIHGEPVNIVENSN